MSARRIDCAQVRTGGHTGPPLRWKLPPRRAVHPKRSRLSFRNEKKLRFLLAYKLRKQRVTRLYIPTRESLRPSLGILSSLRGDFEIPLLGFFRPALGGRFSSHQNGTAIQTIMQRTHDHSRPLQIITRKISGIEWSAHLGAIPQSLLVGIWCSE